MKRLAAVSALLLPFGFSSAAQIAALDAAMPCPAGHLTTPTIEQALSAARRAIVYGHSVSAQGHTFKLTNTNTPVIRAEALGALTDQQKLEDGYWRFVARTCGKSVAQESWAVVFSIGVAPMPSVATRIAFATRTSSGTVVYGTR